MRHLTMLGLVLAVQTSQQACDPVQAQAQFNREQTAVCKRANGLPIMVFDHSLAMSTYRGCQLPCQPAAVYSPEVELR